MDKNQYPFLAGGGEMGALMRAKDWSKTSIGTPDNWPKSLQTMLAVILHSKFPMFIWWGPELLCFYNDAYRPSLGREGKHPSILGQPGQQGWQEIWHLIEPLIKQVLSGGEATWSEDELVPIDRNGRTEGVYWTFSYSRINNDEGEPYGALVTCVETTNKIQYQQKLEESNDLLQFATEAAELGTWDYNPHTGRFVGNKRLKAWFGLEPDEESDLQHSLLAIADHDRQRVIDAIEASLDHNQRAPFDIEYTIIHPVTRVEIFVLVKGKPFFTENGEAYRFSGTMEDITEKNKIRQAVAENEKNLRNLIEQAPVAMCVLKGPQHKVEIVNEKMVQLWGKTLCSVLHKPMFEALPEASGQGLEELLDNVYTTGERFTAKERPVALPRATGIETVYQNFVYEPLRGISGEIEGVIAVTIDVTEQVIARRRVEEAEERARLATESANLGTFDFDIKQQSTVLSDRFREIFDVDTEATHANLLERLHQEDRATRDRAHEDAFNTGVLQYEARVLRRDGTTTWVRVEGKVYRDNNGEPYRLLGTVIDFTGARELEQQREEYIAIASHELRNPLTSLKLALDLLYEMISEPGQRLLVDKSKEQARRLISMTGELLNVSKISSGVLDLKPEVINIRECINDSILTAQIGDERINITGNPDINVNADRFRIEQVLVNLLTNASKYSPRGSAIVVDVSRIPGYIKVEVKDKGIGIETDKLSRVFKKFSRIESREKIDGYGLGLYISDQIIRKHGGQMGVESEKGLGSVFWFTLPY